MGTIESSIGKVASKNQQPMKRFVVDDPTLGGTSQPQEQTYQSQQEQARQEYAPDLAPGITNFDAQSPGQQLDDKTMAEYQEAKRMKGRIAPDKKIKLEALLGLKRIRKTVKIDDHDITLQNISGADMMEALKAVAECKTNLDFIYKSRHILLALSLFAIDGQEVSDILGEEDNLEMRLSVVENISDDALNELHAFYDKEIGVKIPQTGKEMQEIQGDIKKS